MEGQVEGSRGNGSPLLAMTASINGCSATESAEACVLERGWSSRNERHFDRVSAWSPYLSPSELQLSHTRHRGSRVTKAN